MKRLFVILCLCLSFYTQANECSGARPELSVYYGNGMLSDVDDARESRSELKNLSSDLSAGYRVNYKLAINDNEAPIDLLQELARQKILQDFGVLTLWLAGIDEAPDWFKELIADVTAQFPAYSYVRDSDLRKHVGQYMRDIEQCKKVLLVAHSQGNFYGNEAWRLIYENAINNLPLNQLKVMGLVSVATPASYLGAPLHYAEDQPKITRYTTLNNDIVVNLLRMLFPIDPLPGNLENRGESIDWAHHSFISSYATGTPSRQVLADHIRSVAYNLESLPLQRDRLISSALASAGYDTAANILDVEFLRSGGIYRYYDVPESIYDGLMSAESAGGYYNQAIRGRYTSRKLY